jgi:hypothetical protein
MKQARHAVVSRSPIRVSIVNFPNCFLVAIICFFWVAGRIAQVTFKPVEQIDEITDDGSKAIFGPKRQPLAEWRPDIKEYRWLPEGQANTRLLEALRPGQGP